MNEKEIWHKWEPLADNLSRKYAVMSVDNIIGEFNVYLYDQEKESNIRVNFYDSTDISRRTDILYRSGELKKLTAEYGESFFTDWTFFKISNSEYVRDLIKESYEMLNSKHCIHFVIIGSNCIVDVITSYEPKIEVLE